jgi:hypothetical protein
MNPFTLSFKTGNPIAYVDGGKYKGRIVNIAQEGGTNPDSEVDEKSALVEEYIRNSPERLNFRQIQELQRCLINDIEPTNPGLVRTYQNMKATLATVKNKEIKLTDGELRPIIDLTQERQVFYITGMSGSGKSTYVNMLLDSYVKLYKGKRKIFLFSNKEWDNSYENKHITKIKLDEDLTMDPLTMDELKHSMVVFDDIEGVPNREIGRELDRLRDVILQQGRQYQISFCYVSHLANNYKQTRTILNETMCVVVFPYMTTAYSLKYLLEKYFGFDKKQIQKFQKINSRWVCLWKTPTICAMHQKGAYLIN